MLEDLKAGKVEFRLVEEFLLELKKFSGGDEESVKVAELKKIKQGERTMKEFIQEFRRVARESKYKERVLVVKFKKGMNRVIRRKFVETERPLSSIQQ